MNNNEQVIPINVEKVMRGSLEGFINAMDKTRAHAGELLLKTNDKEGAIRVMKLCEEWKSMIEEAFYDEFDYE